MRTIYAELTNRVQSLVDEGIIDIPVPSGITYNRKNGSRSCHFFCDDDLPEEDQSALIDELTESLDGLGINWQEV